MIGNRSPFKSAFAERFNGIFKDKFGMAIHIESYKQALPQLNNVYKLTTF